MSDKEKEQQARPDSIGLDSLSKARRDDIDLNNEIAGRDVGRPKRFLSPDARDEISREGREKDRRFNALMRLLQDPAYARAYEGARAAVDAARRATDAAKIRLAQEAEQAAARLDAIHAAAATLPDGTRVYRSDRDGRIYTEDGLDVSLHEDSITGLNDDAPSYEELREATEASERISERIQQVETYEEEVLAPTEERLNDPDNPYSLDELEELQGNIRASMPVDIGSSYDDYSKGPAMKGGSAAAEYLGDTELGSIRLGDDFRSAHSPDADASGVGPAPSHPPKPG